MRIVIDFANTVGKYFKTSLPEKNEHGLYPPGVSPDGFRTCPFCANTSFCSRNFSHKQCAHCKEHFIDRGVLGFEHVTQPVKIYEIQY